MVELVGFIGSVSFAIVSLPILLAAIKTKSGNNISIGYLVLSLLGNICCFSYVIHTSLVTGYILFPLFLNYGTALTITLILVVIKWKMK